MNEITKADFEAFRGEVLSAFADLKGDVRNLGGKVGALEDKVDANKDELMEFARQIETNLLTEFHRYGKGQQLRLHTLESHDAAIVERLALIEERLLNLETRRPPAA